MTTRPKFHHPLSSVCGAITFVLLMAFPVSGRTQFTPSEGSILNYRFIGFSFPEKKKATAYLIEIAAGNIYTEKEFAAHRIKTVSATENKMVTDVPTFSNQYTWRVVYKDEDIVIGTSKFQHFATGAIAVDSSKLNRLRIDAGTDKVEDAYILVDGINMIFDLKGNPVWYMPNSDAYTGFTDFKMSPSGTLTFLANNNSYEMGCNGSILWQTTNEQINFEGMINSFCHHEFTKLGNGNYMVLISTPPQADYKANDEHWKGRKKFFPNLLTSRLAEFNKKGEVVWDWESQNYIMQSDLQLLQQQYPGFQVDLHENAFVFDEKNKVIYLSMVGIDRIVKLRYPDGKVLAEYGTIYHPPDDGRTTTGKEFPVLAKLLANNLFHNQHGLKLSADDCLYLYSTKYDAGSNAGNSYPQILKMKQSGGALEKVWELSGKTLVKELKNFVGAGGNVEILPNNNLFISLGVPYVRMYIVDADKNILWSAMVESFDLQNKNWIQSSKYRASIITRRQLEQMVLGNKK